MASVSKAEKVQADEPVLPPEPDFTTSASENMVLGVYYLIVGSLAVWQFVNWKPCIYRSKCTTTGWWPARNLPLIIICAVAVAKRIAKGCLVLAGTDCREVADDPEEGTARTSTQAPFTSYYRVPINQWFGFIKDASLLAGVIVFSAWMGGTKPQLTYFQVTVAAAIVFLLSNIILMAVTVMESRIGILLDYMIWVYHGLPRARIYVWVGQWLVLVLYLVHFATCSSPSARDEEALDETPSSNFCVVPLLRMWFAIIFLVLEALYYTYASFYAVIVLPATRHNNTNMPNCVYMPAPGSLEQYDVVPVQEVRIRSLFMLAVVAVVIVFVPGLYSAKPQDWQNQGAFWSGIVISSLTIFYGFMWLFKSDNTMHNAEERQGLVSSRASGSRFASKKHKTSAVQSGTAHVTTYMDRLNQRYRFGQQVHNFAMRNGGHNLTQTWRSQRLSQRSVDAAQAVEEEQRKTETVELDVYGQPKPKIGKADARSAAVETKPAMDMLTPPPLPTRPDARPAAETKPAMDMLTPPTLPTRPARPPAADPPDSAIPSNGPAPVEAGGGSVETAELVDVTVVTDNPVDEPRPKEE